MAGRKDVVNYQSFGRLSVLEQDLACVRLPASQRSSGA
jgi:hypothetical protein